jgi:hypothetical protein
MARQHIDFSTLNSSLGKPMPMYRSMGCRARPLALMTKPEHVPPFYTIPQAGAWTGRGTFPTMWSSICWT